MNEALALKMLENNSVSLRNYTKMVLPKNKAFKLLLKIGGDSFTDNYNVEVGLPSYAVEPTRGERQLKMYQDNLDKLNKPNGFTVLEGFSLVEGLLMHELAHMLYTDFSQFQYIQKVIGDRLVKHGVSERAGRQIGATMFNCTEDGRIEKRIATDYDVENQIKFKNMNVWILNDKVPSSKMFYFSNVIVCIACMGLYPQYFEELKAIDREFYDLMKENYKLIVSATKATSCKILTRRTLRLFDNLEDYIVKMLKEESKNEKFEDILKQLAEDIDFEDTQEIESGEQPNQADTSLSLDGENLKKDFDESSSSGEKSDEEPEDNENQKSSVSGNSDDSEESDESDESNSGNKEDNSDEESTSNNNSEDSNDSDESSGSKDNSDKDSKDDSNSDSKDNDDEKESLLDKIIRELEKVSMMSSLSSKDRIEKPKPEKKSQAMDYLISRDDIYEINDNYSNAVSFVEVLRTYRFVKTTDETKKESKEFVKEMNKIFNNNIRNLENMKSGTLQSKNVHKFQMGQYDIFTKKGNNVKSDLAIEILIDGSSSMGGKKERHANLAASIIEEGLKNHVSLKITSFVGSNGNVEHITLKHFNEKKKDINYVNSFDQGNGRIGGGNKDGYSIRVASKELAKRPEKDKFLIVLSDGLPSAYGHNAIGLNDVKEAVKEARKQKVEVIAIFFGEKATRENNREAYEFMYQKNLISSSVSNIPKNLIRTLKKLIR